LPAITLAAGCEGHAELAGRAKARGLSQVSDWRAYAGPAPEVVRAADSVVRARGGDPRRFFFRGVAVDSVRASARLDVVYETDFEERKGLTIGNPSGRDFELLYSLTAHRVIHVALGQ